MRPFKPNVQNMRVKTGALGLVMALRDEDWHIRQIAAPALGQIGGTRPVEPLITALEEEWALRMAAPHSLIALFRENKIGGQDRQRIFETRNHEPGAQ